MTYYLTARDVMTALAATGQDVQIRDFGLLAAAVARPQSSAFGEDAYPDPWVKAAALLHSLARNHALLDGNKRAAWASAWTFLEINKVARLSEGFDVDPAEHLVLAVAQGDLDDLEQIAVALKGFADLS